MKYRGLLLCCAVLMLAPASSISAQPEKELESLCFPTNRSEDKPLADRKIAACTELLRKNPKRAELFFYRSAANQLKGDFHAAIADLTQAINLKSNRADYYRAQRLYLYNEKVNDLKSALADADYLISISKSKEGEINFRTTRAEIYFGLNRHADADKDLNRILELDPSNSYAKSMLEMVKLQQKLRR